MQSLKDSRQFKKGETNLKVGNEANWDLTTYSRNITVVDDIFASTICLTISNVDLYPEPKSIIEC